MYEEEWLHDNQKIILLILSVSDSLFHCEKLPTRPFLSCEHLKGCIRIAKKQIKPDIEGLLKQKQWEMSHY
jgi:hypothetical protein